MHGMTNGEEQPFYGEMLRKLGAWLDSAGAHRIVVRESEGGFTVRYERQDIDMVFLQRFFACDDLRSMRATDSRLLRVLLPHMGRTMQGMAGEPGGYQELLRALGSRLDGVFARQVLIVEEQATDTLVVTYAVAGPLDAGSTSHLETYGPGERESLRRPRHDGRGAGMVPGPNS